MKLSLPDHIYEQIQGLCEQNEVHLLEAILRGSPQKMLLDIFIDSETGILHSHCKKIGKSLNEIAETDEFLAKVMQIEVSSPGAEQPLRYLWQYPKHIGRTLECTFKDKTKIQGKLISIDNAVIVLSKKTEKKTKETEQSATEQSISFSDIIQAKIVVSFS